MKKHFVTFLSPGTFVAETSSMPIDDWNIFTAIEMSKSVRERYDAVPYGFYFSTRERGDDDLDSHESARSGMYYLGGEVYTVKELEELQDPSNKIFISNMKCNKWKRAVVNTNSWKVMQPLYDGDVVLPLEEME